MSTRDPQNPNRCRNVNRLALLGLILWGEVASAQEPPCSYQACALRVVDGGGYFALPVVVQGSVGYAVANVRRSDTLEDLFTSDSAAAHYESFEFQDRIADWSGWVGSGLILAGLVADYIIGQDGVFSRSFFLYGGGAAVIWGVAMPAERRAMTEMSTAIWWYNQDLIRSP